ncbi:hypothetical protein Tco_1372477, partial [Tanacetum coccineum]
FDSSCSHYKSTYIEQFWNTISSQTVNDVKQINAIVDSKAVVVIEASIRSSLLFNYADGTACLTNEAIFQNLALMGYEGELNKLTFQKALFSPQWKYLIYTILHCLSSKSTSWNEFSINIASTVTCLATNQKFKFSKLIFDGLLRNLDTSKKKFLMYPRFLMVFLNNQIELGEPFNDVYVTPAHTQKVFSNMSRKDSRDSLKGTNGSEGDQVQPSHDSPLLGGPTSDRAEGGMTLEELYVFCTNLSNMVLALEASKDAQAAEIIKLKTKIKKLKKKRRKESISKQGRKNAKSRPTLDSFDDLDADLAHGMEYMDTEEAMNKKGESTISTVRLERVNTAGVPVNTDDPEISVVEPRTPPTTASIFNDEDVTMAQTLIKMKEEKAKEKEVAFKDVEDSS